MGDVIQFPGKESASGALPTPQFVPDHTKHDTNNQILIKAMQIAHKAIDNSLCKADDMDCRIDMLQELFTESLATYLENGGRPTFAMNLARKIIKDYKASLKG